MPVGRPAIDTLKQQLHLNLSTSLKERLRTQIPNCCQDRLKEGINIVEYEHIPSVDIIEMNVLLGRISDVEVRNMVSYSIHRKQRLKLNLYGTNVGISILSSH